MTESPRSTFPAAADSKPMVQRIRYGADPSQYGQLHRPHAGPPRAVVVVIHGGFWRARYDASLGTPLAVDLAGRGFAAWNVEYRRLGAGGGWPTTFEDVSAALDRLADLEPPADLDGPAGHPVVLLGHSAGGQLAVWLASRRDGRVRPTGVVSQAGVLDLAAASAAGLSGGVTDELLGGGPTQVPERYRAASPVELLPTGVPVRCLHGDADVDVPFQQSADYCAAAQAAGDDCTLRRLPGADHFGLITVGDPAWEASVAAIEELISR